MLNSELSGWVQEVQGALFSQKHRLLAYSVDALLMAGIRI